jgi:hypothetical protein
MILFGAQICSTAKKKKKRLLQPCHSDELKHQAIPTTTMVFQFQRADLTPFVPPARNKDWAILCRVIPFTSQLPQRWLEKFLLQAPAIQKTHLVQALVQLWHVHF